MYYFYAVNVPANTPITAPVTQRLGANQGTISFIEVHFPDGCTGLVKAVLEYNAIQVVPWNANSYLYGNDRLFRLDLNLPLKEPPFEFVIRAYNDDDTYDHLLSIGIMVVEENAVSMLQLLLGK